MMKLKTKRIDAQDNYSLEVKITEMTHNKNIKVESVSYDSHNGQFSAIVLYRDVYNRIPD